MEVSFADILREGDRGLIQTLYIIMTCMMNTTRVSVQSSRLLCVYVTVTYATYLSDNPLNSTRSTMQNEYITGEESAKAIYYMSSLFMMIESRPQHSTTQ